MAQLRVYKVVCELEVEEAVGGQCPLVGGEFGENIFEVLEIVTEFEGGVVGEELVEL